MIMMMMMIMTIMKYSELSDLYTCYPVTDETQGPLTEMAYELVGDHGRHITRLSGDDCDEFFFVPTPVCCSTAL